MTQVLHLLRLAPEVRVAVLALGDPLHGRIVGTHTLRLLSKLSVEEQECRAVELVGHSGAQG